MTLSLRDRIGHQAWRAGDNKLANVFVEQSQKNACSVHACSDGVRWMSQTFEHLLMLRLAQCGKKRGWSTMGCTMASGTVTPLRWAVRSSLFVGFEDMSRHTARGGSDAPPLRSHHAHVQYLWLTQ